MLSQHHLALQAGYRTCLGLSIARESQLVLPYCGGKWGKEVPVPPSPVWHLTPFYFFLFLV